MIDIKGIDYDEMRERLMCDEDSCRLIIRTFLTDVSEKLKNINQETDNERFITLAHGMKGSCANISAMECYECAKKLELKAREQGKDACGAELEKVNEMLAALLKSIEEYFADAGETQPLDGNEEDGIFFLNL